MISHKTGHETQNQARLPKAKIRQYIKLELEGGREIFIYQLCLPIASVRVDRSAPTSEHPHPGGPNPAQPSSTNAAEPCQQGMCCILWCGVETVTATSSREGIICSLALGQPGKLDRTGS